MTSTPSRSRSHKRQRYPSRSLSLWHLIPMGYFSRSPPPPPSKGKFTYGPPKPPASFAACPLEMRLMQDPRSSTPSTSPRLSAMLSGGDKHSSAAAKRTRMIRLRTLVRARIPRRLG